MNIHDSIHLILESRDTFADLFYRVFLERYPKIRKHFEGVNLKHQGVLLSMALLVIERHSSGSYPATKMYLNYLGTKHHDRGIPAKLYPNFQNALLATLKRFHGSDWHPELKDQWREAIKRTIDAMLEGYRQRYTV